MKRNLVFVLGALTITALMFVNVTTVLDSSRSFDISYAALQKVFAQEGDVPEPTYPKGRACKQDPCTREVGMPPYVVTFYGHHWHCGDVDYESTCDSSQCDRPCDA